MARQRKAAKRMVGGIGPRGVRARPGRGTPLPPKGIASGAEPVITGVVAQGDRTVIVSGKNLTSVHFYIQGAAAGPEAHLLEGKKGYGQRGMWIRHGKMFWDGHDVDPKGKYNLWLVTSRSDSKIVLDLVDPAAGKVTIYGFAQDKAMGQAGEHATYDVHYGTGSQGKPIAGTGFPKTIQFGGIKTAATKPSSKPSRPSRPSRRSKTARRRIGRR